MKRNQTQTYIRWIVDSQWTVRGSSLSSTFFRRARYVRPGKPMENTSIHRGLSRNNHRTLRPPCRVVRFLLEFINIHKRVSLPPKFNSSPLKDDGKGRRSFPFGFW